MFAHESPLAQGLYCWLVVHRCKHGDALVVGLVVSVLVVRACDTSCAVRDQCTHDYSVVVAYDLPGVVLATRPLHDVGVGAWRY